jgi:SNF2 family DNA or RNA helicase
MADSFKVCIHPFLVMRKVTEDWSEKEMQQAVSDVKAGNVTELYKKLVVELTAVGDVAECPICMDPHVDPLITPCRHIFCSDCIHGVFDNPAAHGQVEGEEDNDVEEVGLKIACPSCRAKVCRADLKEYVPPEERRQQKLDNETALALYRTLQEKNFEDYESDEESLPDITVALRQRASMKTDPVKRDPTVPLPMETPVAAQIIEIDENADDLFDVFRQDPVPVEHTTRNCTRKMPEHWANLVYKQQWMPSTKLTALRDQLSAWRQEAGSDKVIVFSNFVMALDLVQRICEMEKWKCCRYHGEMKIDERDETIEQFEEDEEMQFMLTSIKCGGVGLNLTSIPNYTRTISNGSVESCRYP